MIIIESLHLINYGSHANSFIELKSNITSILAEFAENKDRSNGGGKSTILDGIRFALFGKGKFSKQEEVLRKHNGKIVGDTEVTLILSNELKIVRRLINQKNSVKGELIVECNGQTFLQSEGQTEIEKILDENYNLFTASYFFPEGETDLFTNTTPSFRRDYINSIFEEKLKVYRKTIETVSGQFKQLTENKKQSENTFEIYSKDMVNAKTQLDGLSLLSEKELTALEEDLLKITATLTEKEKELKELTSPEILKKYTELQSIIETSTQDISRVKEETESLIQKINSNSERINSFIFTRGLKEKVDVLKNNLERTKETLTHYMIQKSPIANKIETLDRLEGTCPTCGQTITEDYKKTILNDLNIQLDEIEASIESISKVKQIETQELGTLLVENDTQQKKKQEKEQLETMNSNYLFLTEKNKQIQIQLEEKLVLLREELNIVQEKVLNQSDNSKLKEEITTLKDSYASLKLKLDMQKQSAGRKLQLEETLQTLAEKIKVLDFELLILRDDLTTTDLSLSIAKESLNFASKYYLESIEDESNVILSKINPEYSFSIEEKDNANKDIELYLTVRGNPTSYKRLSLGEKRMVDVACRLAISSVLNMGKKSKIGFVCIDEIFSNLDVYNQKQLLIIFNEIKTKFEQIIILDHSPYLKDVFQSITVSMENGVSKIKR